MSSADVSIGELIRTADRGDRQAAADLFAVLYGELHSIAERQLRRGGAELTLGTTTLLHETYLNIAEREGVRFASRGHFLGYAARAMRGLTIDYVRRRRAKKRGGEFHITWTGNEGASDDSRPSRSSGSSDSARCSTGSPRARRTSPNWWTSTSFAASPSPSWRSCKGYPTARSADTGGTRACSCTGPCRIYSGRRPGAKHAEPVTVPRRV